MCEIDQTCESSWWLLNGTVQVSSEQSPAQRGSRVMMRSVTMNPGTLRPHWRPLFWALGREATLSFSRSQAFYTTGYWRHFVKTRQGSNWELEWLLGNREGVTLLFIFRFFTSATRTQWEVARGKQYQQTKHSSSSVFTRAQTWWGSWGGPAWRWSAAGPAAAAGSSPSPGLRPGRTRGRRMAGGEGMWRRWWGPGWCWSWQSKSSIFLQTGDCGCSPDLSHIL